MRAIRITRRFPARTRNYNPGVYLVPEEISKKEAKLALLDAYGRAAADEDQAEVDHAVQDFRKRTAGGRKGPAPEDKRRGDAPENKQAVGGEPAGDSGGVGTKPGGARALTTQTAAGRPAHRGK